MDQRWIANALTSAFFFAFGDFMTVKSQTERSFGAMPVFVSYTILMGIIALTLVYHNKDFYQALTNYNRNDWIVIIVLSVVFMIAYYTHFVAISEAPNPGYANTLVMFHVILLSVLSYFFLDKPLTKWALIGIILVFIGTYIVLTES